MIIQQLSISSGSHDPYLYQISFSFVPTSKEIPQQETETACNTLFQKRKKNYTSST